MSRKTKKISYANTVRRSTSLDIKEIPIKQWLKHHGLEDFHHTIFVKKHIMYNSRAEAYPYEYSYLLTNIKTNIELLFSFSDSFKLISLSWGYASNNSGCLSISPSLVPVLITGGIVPASVTSSPNS